MDDGAGGGGDGDDCSSRATKVLEEIVDHEMGAFDVGFLQCYVKLKFGGIERSPWKSKNIRTKFSHHRAGSMSPIEPAFKAPAELIRTSTLSKCLLRSS